MQATDWPDRVQDFESDELRVDGFRSYAFQPVGSSSRYITRLAKAASQSAAISVRRRQSPIHQLQRPPSPWLLDNKRPRLYVLHFAYMQMMNVLHWPGVEMPATKEERVRVAVRVRPLSDREATKGCKNIVQMFGGQTVVIANPADESDRKSFNYDHAYWSFDGFKVDDAGRNVPDHNHPRGGEYCDQWRLYEDLGNAALVDALDGYNTTLFSYGQTGSGKSYSIMGYGRNEGILPLFCNRLFETIQRRPSSDDAVHYEIQLSMLEIYNEFVYDLLNPLKNVKGLKVREHPKKGFFAEGLKSFSVTNAVEVQRLIEQGTLNRTVVATNMNATSSRAHTIVSLVLVQKKTAGSVLETTTATVNIVDLAGSERASKTGNASGERFREGVAINQSLQCLGHCIHALAESSAPSSGGSVSQKRTRIPYRDSVLTKLLMNALGGNSKTIMIASISPADANYDETLSTLRYADRAKQITTRALVNKNPAEKVVRELKLENQRLKAVLARGNIDPQWLKTRLKGQPTNPQVVKGAKKKWEDELRAQMSENEREIKDIREPEIAHHAAIETQMEAQPSKRTGPYLENVNMDPLLNARWMHFLKHGPTLIGKRGAGDQQFIEMMGPGMQENHAELLVDGNTVILKPLSSNGRVLVNGVPVAKQSTAHLQPNDRLVFGATQLWLFRHPELESVAGVSDSPMINYDFFLNEMASRSGLDVMSSVSEERASLQEELVGLLPLVDEANGISAELDKPAKFEIILIAPQAVHNNQEKTLPSQVYVKMRNVQNGYDYLWSKDKFLNRFDLMKELYRRHLQKYYGEEDETNDQPPITIDSDPFLEAPDAVVIIGVAKIFLQPLAFLVEIKDSIPVTDLQGSAVGMMDVAIVPCADRTGRSLRESPNIDYPEQLVGRNTYFDFHIIGCRSLPPKFKDLHCKYCFYGEKVDTSTDVHPFSSNIMFNHNRIICCEPASREFVSYLSHGSLVIEVLGRHAPPDRHSAESSNTADHMFLSQRFDSSSSGNESHVTNRVTSGSIREEEATSEYHSVRQDHKRMRDRLDDIRQLTDRCLYVGQESIPTALLDAMLNVNSPKKPLAVNRDVSGGALEWRNYEIPDQRNEPRNSSICSIS